MAEGIRKYLNRLCPKISRYFTKAMIPIFEPTEIQEPVASLSLPRNPMKKAVKPIIQLDPIK